MKICIVCSHGGHLTEALEMMAAFDGHETFFVTYDSVRTRELERVYLLPYIGLNPIKMLACLPKMWRVLWRERPDILFSTGSEIAIPVFYLAKLLRIKTIYVETCSRVHMPTGTGRMVYPISDLFLVQWKELLSVYGPKAQYRGGLL
jgi:UDP-N-acetylglucosamine:LPS N-acetylglucosamine transferase